jgi:hypothetical protein
MVCYLRGRLRPARHHRGHLDDTATLDARVGCRVISTVVTGIGGGAIAVQYFRLQEWVDSVTGLVALGGLIFFKSYRVQTRGRLPLMEAHVLSLVPLDFLSLGDGTLPPNKRTWPVHSHSPASLATSGSERIA